MADELEAGDVVRLNSGGPNMTVKGIGRYGSIANHDEALCVWFDEKTKQLREQTFDPILLRKLVRQSAGFVLAR